VSPGGARDVTLVFSWRNPGKYAFNVLAGALEDLEAAGGLHLVFAPDDDAMDAAIRTSLDAGRGTLVLWSFYSPGLPECADQRARMQGKFPSNSFTSIAGGVHATAEPDETLDGGFDFVAIGEGEHVLREVVRRSGSGESLEGTPGLCRRGSGGEPRVVKFGKAPPVSDLDTFAPFSLRHAKFGAIEVTRGCVYACRFCQTPYLAKARFRHRSVANVAAHAKAMREAGLRDVRFVSPTALSYGSNDESVNLDAVESLLAAVREAMGTDGRVFYGTFPSEVRPEHVTPEALRILKRYVDNDNLIIGGQSGSQRILDESHRGHDVDAIERAVRLSVENGFLPNVDFIVGLPGEETPDATASLDLMERLSSLGARVHAHTFMPLPGTPFRRSAPGKVEGETRRRLEVLASSGRVYGQWKRQERVASDLGERRDRRR